MRYLVKTTLLFAFLLTSCGLLIFGCNADHTPTITINGIPLDVVQVSRISAQREPRCCSLGPVTGFQCKDQVAIPLDESGVGFHDAMGDNTFYTGSGLHSGCSVTFLLPECNDVTVLCGTSTFAGAGGGGCTGIGGNGFNPDNGGAGDDGCSPIIIDLTGDGFKLTSAQDDVLFDITGTGKPIQIAWTAKGARNGFLALDRNHTGKIDSGAELFGNFTAQPRSTQPNGFLALADFDTARNGGNGDGVIDQRDAIFQDLVIWIDENHDGISQPGEIHSLPELGIYSLNLNYKESRRKDEFGNLFRFKGKVNPENRQDQTEVGRWAYDVFLTTEKPSTAHVAVTGSTLSKLRCEAAIARVSRSSSKSTR